MDVGAGVGVGVWACVSSSRKLLLLVTAFFIPLARCAGTGMVSDPSPSRPTHAYLDQVVAYGAADTAVEHLDDFVFRVLLHVLFQQSVIDANISELVFDHRDALPMLRRQDVLPETGSRGAAGVGGVGFGGATSRVPPRATRAVKIVCSGAFGIRAAIRRTGDGVGTARQQKGSQQLRPRTLINVVLPLPRNPVSTCRIGLFRGGH